MHIDKTSVLCINLYLLYCIVYLSTFGYEWNALQTNVHVVKNNKYPTSELIIKSNQKSQHHWSSFGFQRICWAYCKTTALSLYWSKWS